MKHWKMQIVLACLSIQVAVSSDASKETSTKQLIRELESINAAYEKHQTRAEPLDYTTLRLKGIDISTKDLLCLHATLCDTIAPKAITIITMRKRDRDVSDCKDTIMANLISAIQQNINDEHLTRFSTGNMVVNVDFVEEEQMPGYLMLRNADEKLRIVFRKLNALVIEYYPKIIYETYKQWVIRYLYVSVEESIHTGPVYACWWQRGLDDAIDEYFEANLCNLLSSIKNIFANINERKALQYEMSRCSSVLQCVYAKVAEFENSIGFRFFSDNLDEFYKSSNHMIWDFCNSSINLDISSISKLGFEAIRNANNKNQLKNLFKVSCRVMIRYSPLSMTLYSENGTFKSGFDTYVGDIGETHRNFFKDIGLDAILENLCKTPSFRDNLYKRLQEHIHTKIVINEKLSIDNFNLVCRILCSEFDADLNGFQSMYVDIGRNIAQHILVTGSDPFDAKSVVLKNGTKITISDGEKLEVISKTIDKSRKSNVNGSSHSHSILISDMSESVVCSKENEKFAVETIETVKKMILECEITEEIKTPMLACLEKSSSRPTGLHKITVPSSTQLTEIYILNHQPIGDKNEMISIIYVDIVANQSKSDTLCQRKVKSVRYLEDILIRQLNELYIQIQLFQVTHANEFTIPNIISVRDKNFAYLKTRLRLYDDCIALDKTAFFDKSQIGWDRWPFCLIIDVSSIINKKYVDTLIDDVMVFANLCNFAITKEETDLLLNKLCLDTDILKSELDDLCVLSREHTQYYIEMLPKFFTDGEYILDIYIVRESKNLESVTFNIHKNLNKMYNNKHRTSSLHALSCIAYALENDVNTIPLVINAILESNDFRFLSTEDKKSGKEILAFKILQKIGSLFGYTERWKMTYSKNPEKAKLQTAFYLKHKDIIKSKIKILLKRILDDENYPKALSVMDIISIKKLKTLEADSNGVDIMYGNLKHLNMKKKMFQQK